MKNMIVDMIRLPTDEYGSFLYDMEDTMEIFNKYAEYFPDHLIFAMPDKIKIWEDMDIDSLKATRERLDEIITSKEIEENGL